jgi:tetratricopeptide (TPR) repeat protein
MSSSVFIPTSSTFNMTTINQTAQSNQTQLAQYAISQAATFLSKNDDTGAITSLKKALALDPQNTTAYNYLGKIYLSQGKNSDAISAYKHLVSILGNSASSYSASVTATSITNATENLYSSAAPTLQTAYVSLGNAYLQDKQYTQSETAFKKAEQLNPQDPVAPYTLGQQYLTQGKLSAALAQFQKAQKLDPKDGNVYYGLGEVYNKQGDYKQAATELTKALNLKSDFPAANYQLGLAYNGLGETTKAQNQLSILDDSDTTLASQLSTVLDKPQMVALDSTATQNNSFDSVLGPGTPLWMLDPSLLTKPNSSDEFTVTISFNNAMSASSVMNTANWSISPADSTQAGYYDDMMPRTSKDATLPKTPTSVTYNALKNEATVTFQLSQNSDGTAVIDPSHLVFTFNGVDSEGRAMDQTANSIDGANSAPF